MKNDREIDVAQHETVAISTNEHSTILLEIGEVKKNTDAINRLAKDTQGLVKDTRIGVYITIGLSITAILLSAAAIIVSLIVH